MYGGRSVAAATPARLTRASPSAADAAICKALLHTSAAMRHPMMAVRPLRAAVVHAQPTPNCLTVIHSYFVQVRPHRRLGSRAAGRPVRAAH